jgi:hypothetical protein
MASDLTTYLAEPLATLYDACTGISQWKPIRDACGPTLQRQPIYRTEETRASLANLRDSLKDIAGNLLILSLTGEIPNKRIPAQQRAAELIDTLPHALYNLKESVQYYDDIAILDLKKTAEEMGKLAAQLEASIGFEQPPSQILVQKNSKIEGFAEHMTNNSYMGPSGVQAQRIVLDNCVSSARPGSLSISSSHNKCIVLNNVPASQYQEIMKNCLPPAAIQSLIQAVNRIPLEMRKHIPPREQRFLQDLVTL